MTEFRRLHDLSVLFQPLFLNCISKHILEYRGSNRDTIFKNFPETGDCFVKSKIKQWKRHFFEKGTGDCCQIWNKIKQWRKKHFSQKGDGEDPEGSGASRQRAGIFYLPQVWTSTGVNFIFIYVYLPFFMILYLPLVWIVFVFIFNFKAILDPFYPLFRP